MDTENKEVKTEQQIDYENRVKEYIERLQKNSEKLKIGL